MPKKRLFISLNPDQNVLNELGKIQQNLKEKYPVHNIRWGESDKLHLTLRFLGDINEENIPALAGTLERLKFDFETISFETDRIGFFPDNKYPNVIYAGLIESGNNTELLVGFIDKIIFNFGVKPDKKFIPHITLGRFNRSKRIKINEPENTAINKFTVEFDSFNLMQSSLTPDGSVYELINIFNFRK